MKMNKIKSIVAEEVKRQRKRLFTEQETAVPSPAPQSTDYVPPEQTNKSPALNKKKAAGIIVGALKTLFNSDAIQGVDRTHLKDLARHMINSLDSQVKSISSSQTQDVNTDDLVDDSAFDKAENKFDDAGQYDDDLSKKVPDTKPEDDKSEEPMDEPLFESSHFKKFLGED